jgi:hypothetical protein
VDEEEAWRGRRGKSRKVGEEKCRKVGEERSEVEVQDTVR